MPMHKRIATCQRLSEVVKRLSKWQPKNTAKVTADEHGAKHFVARALKRIPMVGTDKFSREFKGLLRANP